MPNLISLFQSADKRHDVVAEDVPASADVHMPSAVYNVAVFLACAACACGENRYLKPRVILKQKRKALTYHSRCSYDSYLILFHYDSSEYYKISKSSCLIRLFIIK